MVYKQAERGLSKGGDIPYILGCMNTNVSRVLEILQNEVDGDVAAALSKMTDDYTMTWMYKGRKELFPASAKEIEAELGEVYQIKGRQYDIRNIVEGGDVVMVELVESYPGPATGKLHQTPLILVLEMEDGKIKRGRHYCDPQLSYEDLTQEGIEAAYKGSGTKQTIK